MIEKLLVINLVKGVPLKVLPSFRDILKITENDYNNNIYLLQLGCYSVAMVILHVYKT